MEKSQPSLEFGTLNGAGGGNLLLCFLQGFAQGGLFFSGILDRSLILPASLLFLADLLAQLTLLFTLLVFEQLCRYRPTQLLQAGVHILLCDPRVAKRCSIEVDQGSGIADLLLKLAVIVRFGTRKDGVDLSVECVYDEPNRGIATVCLNIITRSRPTRLDHETREVPSCFELLACLSEAEFFRQVVQEVVGRHDVRVAIPFYDILHGLGCISEMFGFAHSGQGIPSHLLGTFLGIGNDLGGISNGLLQSALSLIHL
ncbi:hypothetical protein EMIT053CA3_60103 [Pseudomonas donghuensis]